MKRTSGNATIKENWWIIVGPILFIFLGILVIILPYIIQPIDYGSLQTKDVTVEEFKYYNRTSGSSYADISTAEGERYAVTGDYQRKQLKALLTKGTTITIKWYKNAPFEGLCAEEVYVDGERIVAYNDDSPVYKKISLVVGVCVIVLGLVSLYYVRLILVALAEQNKRNEKAKRKYKKK